VRLGTPAYHLSQEGDPKQDQQNEADQEYSPHNIGHVVAKPVLIASSIRDIRNYEKDDV
jgi:hypothetical protein